MGKTVSDSFERQLKQLVQAHKRCNGCRQKKRVDSWRKRNPTGIQVFRNNSGESVPPYSVMEVESVEYSSGRQVLVIKKPTGDASKPHVFNTARTVPAGDKGLWAWGTIKVAVTGTPSAGDNWGVTSSSWVLSSGGDPLMKMCGLLSTGYAMAQPYTENCACGAGALEIVTTSGGTPATYASYSFGNVLYELTFDSQTYSDGDTLTIVGSLTYTSGPAPSTDYVSLSSALVNPTGLGGDYIEDVTVATTDATTSATTGNQIQERKQVSPTVGVADTITITLDYTAAATGTNACNGYSRVMRVGGFSYGGLAYLRTLVC